MKPAVPVIRIRMSELALIEGEGALIAPVLEGSDAAVISKVF
jgi:hypothetical protein